ncbi:hypothetical protein JXJ21_22570 [candidate division KSB1 bacterium]|nr:hypothetical protein [candidate division KSB1 bacterium]
MVFDVLFKKVKLPAKKSSNKRWIFIGSGALAAIFSGLAFFFANKKTKSAQPAAEAQPVAAEGV